MQMTRLVAIEVARPLGGDADPVEDPEQATAFDELDKTAIERDPEGLVRIIELAGMGQPERRPEIGLRGRVEALIETLDDLLEQPPQDAIEAALWRGGDRQSDPVAKAPRERAV